MNPLKFYLLSLIFSLGFGTAYSQEDQKNDTLIGLVINKDGKGIRNVPVSAKGLTQAILTDKKGVFMIVGKGLPDSITLILPSKTIFKIPVKGMRFLKILTKENQYSVSEAKDEIVNIGYGSVRKSRSSTNEVELSGDVLKETGETSIVNAIAGRVPGVVVVYKDDGSTNLKIRGGSSLQGSNDPLYILDGTIIEDPRIVNINDVAKVTILKDGSMYGVRGANGVVMITTKR